MEYKFPKGFFWGAATSSHQVEGNNHNDWSIWEQSEKRVEELKRRGLDPRDFVSGRAADSYNRYEEDLDIAKSLNHNVHRFSIEWSRIEPEKGKFDEEEMRHYKTLIGAIRSRGMEPMVTLWHFTNPIWFSQEGGFSNKQSSQYFTRYVKYVVDSLKDEVHLWITFNEATTIYSGISYLLGIWPPQEKSLLKAWRVNQNIIKSHIEAYKVIHELYRLSPADKEVLSGESPVLSTAVAEGRDGVMSHNVRQGIFVGSVENYGYVVSGRMLKVLGISKLFDYFRNLYFWSKSLPYQDFLGLNYYVPHRLPGSYKFLPKLEITDMPMKIGESVTYWEIYPEGIYRILKKLSKFRKPIYITENGIADRTDLKREKFIRDHLYWVHKAISEGADIRGYMYWSLLDNFEWAEGYAPRFGLVEVNYDTMERKIRTSAFKYAEICKTNTLEY